MRARLVFVPLLATAFWVPAPADAEAATATAATCAYEAHEIGSPGLSLIVPTRGHNVTVPPAAIQCLGVVGGRALAAAPGTIFYTATYGTGTLTKDGGDTCVLGSGDGWMRLSLPAVHGGAISLEGPFQWEAVWLAGVLRGQLGQLRMDMALQFRPDPAYPKEDCVQEPLRHFITTGQGALHQAVVLGR